MKLLISPHSDDSVLFTGYTLIREKPLVLTITDSYIQQNRGENITAEQRRLEDEEAMKILGCPIIFGGIRDDVIDEYLVRNLLKKFKNFEVIAPTVHEKGNPHHNLIGKVAKEIFGNIRQYCSYSTTDLKIKGTQEIIPTQEEQALKYRALDCYKSQIACVSTAPHFKERGGSEWYI